MLDRIRHINSANEVLDFNALGIYTNYNDLRDYEWTASAENNYITGLTRGVVKKSIPFIFCCSEEDACKIKNLFYEHFEKDILNREPGYFEINGYRYYCYLTKSKKKEYLVSRRLLKLEVEVTSDYPYWIMENKWSYSSETTAAGADSKIYPYQYYYVYGKAPGSESITNDSLKASHFRFIIYGPVSNPEVSVAGHLYNVNCDVGNGEYLVIDSRSREIYIVTISGQKINVFDKRNFNSYIFEAIPVGYNLISWSGGFGFDLTVFDERSEPKWT